MLFIVSELIFTWLIFKFDTDLLDIMQWKLKPVDIAFSTMLHSLQKMPLMTWASEGMFDKQRTLLPWTQFNIGSNSMILFRSILCWVTSYAAVSRLIYVPDLVLMLSNALFHLSSWVLTQCFFELTVLKKCFTHHLCY